MHHPTPRAQALRLVLLVSLVVLALSACGGGGGGQQQQANEQAKKSGGENPLVGTWRRVRKCEEQVRLMKEAGLAEMIPDWVSPSEFSNAPSANDRLRAGDTLIVLGTREQITRLERLMHGEKLQ